MSDDGDAVPGDVEETEFAARPVDLGGDVIAPSICR